MCMFWNSLRFYFYENSLDLGPTLDPFTDFVCIYFTQQKNIFLSFTSFGTKWVHICVITVSPMLHRTSQHELEMLLMLPMLLRQCFYCCRWYITCRLPECFLYFSGFSSSFAWSVAVTVSTMYIICNVHPLSQAMWQHLAKLLFCGTNPPPANTGKFRDITWKQFSQCECHFHCHRNYCCTLFPFVCLSPSLCGIVYLLFAANVENYSRPFS